MAQKSITTRPEMGKTFSIAIWLLGTLAAIQVTAMGWALATRPVTEPPSGTAPPPRSPGAERIVVIPPASTPSGSVTLQDSPSASGPTTIPGVITSGPGAPVGGPDPTPGSTLPPMPQLINPDQAPPPQPGSTSFPPPPSPPGSLIATGPAPGDSPLPAPGFKGPEPPPPLSTLLADAVLQSTPDLAIPDLEIAGLVDSGAVRRANGDMQGALDDLRSAEAALPEHPRVMAEIAATYGEMGLDRKSSLYWDHVRELGPEAGGAWYDIAVAELTGDRGAIGKSPPVLKLGRVTAAHDQTVTEGERVVLSVTVEADPKAKPSASEMAMLVYFYDLVDEDHTEASTAETSQNFSSAPYDWQSGGQETIEVIYHQSEMTADRKRELGKRDYYGYIIELYYRDELQDTAAFPPDLQNLDPESPPIPLNDQPIGPDNSLFPSPVPNEDA